MTRIRKAFIQCLILLLLFSHGNIGWQIARTLCSQETVVSFNCGCDAEICCCQKLSDSMCGTSESAKVREKKELRISSCSGEKPGLHANFFSFHAVLAFTTILQQLPETKEFPAQQLFSFINLDFQLYHPPKTLSFSS